MLCNFYNTQNYVFILQVNSHKDYIKKKNRNGENM